LFAFFEDHADFGELLKAEPQGCFALFEVGPVELVLPAKFLLGRLDFLTGFLQVILLEADAVFEQIAFLLEPGELVAVLVFQALPFVAEARFALFDAPLEIVFNLRAGPFEFAAGSLDLFAYAAALLFDLVDLQFFECGQLVDRTVPLDLEFLVFLLDDFPLGGQLRLEPLAFAAELVELALAKCLQLVLRPLLGRLGDVTAIGEEFLFGRALGIPGGPLALERGPFFLQLDFDLRAERAAFDFQPRAECPRRFFVFASATLELAGECPTLFLERLPRLAERQTLDLEVAIDVGPQIGPLGGDLVSQAEHDPFLFLEIADQAFAGTDFFVQVAFAGRVVGLPLEHVLFEFVDPHPRAAPLLIEQRVLFVECLLPPFELFAFRAKMGGNLRRLPQDFLFAA
jgi:hypothetical protein